MPPPTFWLLPVGPYTHVPAVRPALEHWVAEPVRQYAAAVQFIHRHGWSLVRVTASVLWLVAWSALTVTGTIPKDFSSALPLFAMTVPTVLLVVAEVNHAQARPDIRIGNAQPVEPYVIHAASTQISIIKGLRIPISNEGAPVEVTPYLGISPDPAANPRVRVLHREQDWLTAHGTEFAERTMLAKGESRWFSVFSIADYGSGFCAVVHNALAYGSVEPVDLRGSYAVTITVVGGNEGPCRRRFSLVIEPGTGELRLDP
jgi:hypothetical protein